MKLIAIETATGKRYPVREAGETWILVQTGKQSYVYEKAGERYTLHVSTGVTDKHGREILDVDVLVDHNKSVWKVIWNGTVWMVLGGRVSLSNELTPELAKTMEVAE